MNRIVLLVLAVSLAACGVKRPLMKPSAIPAYEEKLEKKQRRLNQDQKTVEQSAQPTPEVPQ